MSEQEIKKLKLAKYKCDNSLLFFTRYFFKKLKNQKFILNWHHEVICSKLEDVSNYKLVFLNINISPRTSKTELIVNFIAKNLGQNPGGNYLYITASDDLRSETSVKIRDIITCPEYQAMYGLELKKDQNAKNLWRTQRGGGLKTATIFGQIIGFGAGQMIEHNEDLIDFIRDFEGCIILDDINKISDAEALSANNTKTNNIIFSTIFSRKNSKDTPIINIQQRAGMEDATSSLLNYYKEDDKVCSLVIPIVKDGVPMWKWKFPLDEIEKLKISPETSHIFETQYMQNPMPQKGLVYPNTFKTYKTLPIEPDNENETKLQGWCMMFIDSADKGDDHFAAPIVQVIGNAVYLKDVIFDKDELITQEPAVKAKVDEHGCSLIVIETNHAGNYFSKRIRTLLPNINIFGQWSSTNKIDRILSVSGLVNRYLYVPEKPNPLITNYLDECYRLLKTSKKKDDAPDSLSGLFAHLEKHYGIFNE